jgi:Protein involved in cell division
MQVPALLADIALQVKHQVASIQPFPNGNGRHGRLIADVLIEQLGAPRFSWGGSSSLVEATALRQQYIAALQRADRGDISDLLAFARAS